MRNDKWLLFLLDYAQKMRHLGHGSAHERRIRALDHLVQPPQAKTANNPFLSQRAGNRTAIILNPNLRRPRLLPGFLLLDHAVNDGRRCRLFPITPRPASRAAARLRAGPSFSISHRKSRALHCEDWLIRAPSCARREHPPPASPLAPRLRRSLRFLG